MSQFDSAAERFGKFVLKVANHIEATPMRKRVAVPVAIAGLLIEVSLAANGDAFAAAVVAWWTLLASSGLAWGPDVYNRMAQGKQTKQSEWPEDWTTTNSH